MINIFPLIKFFPLLSVPLSINTRINVSRIWQVFYLHEKCQLLLKHQFLRTYNLYMHSCKKFVDNMYHTFSRTDATTIIMSTILNVYPKQIIIWFKSNFHEVFSVFDWFIIIYYFKFSFSSFSDFCVIF